MCHLKGRTIKYSQNRLKQNMMKLNSAGCICTNVEATFMNEVILDKKQVKRKRQCTNFNDP